VVLLDELDGVRRVEALHDDDPVSFEHLGAANAKPLTWYSGETTRMVC